LLLAGLAAANGEAEEKIADLRRRNQELLAQLDSLRESVRSSEPVPSPPSGTRWEWPVEDLLADRAWWDRWLPRLYELLGRDLSREIASGRPGFAVGRREEVVDARGYGDLLTYLFPPVGKITWHSVEYPAAASGQATDGAHEGLQVPVRPDVWEPVLRHVALALCALEATAAANADPQLRMEAEARITGSWVHVLRTLVGEQPPTPLPGPIR
jgi:hypothetical protein